MQYLGFILNVSGEFIASDPIFYYTHEHYINIPNVKTGKWHAYINTNDYENYGIYLIHESNKFQIQEDMYLGWEQLEDFVVSLNHFTSIFDRSKYLIIDKNTDFICKYRQIQGTEEEKWFLLMHSLCNNAQQSDRTLSGVCMFNNESNSSLLYLDKERINNKYYSNKGKVKGIFLNLYFKDEEEDLNNG